MYQFHQLNWFIFGNILYWYSASYLLPFWNKCCHFCFMVEYWKLTSRSFNIMLSRLPPKILGLMDIVTLNVYFKEAVFLKDDIKSIFLFMKIKYVSVILEVLTYLVPICFRYCEVLKNNLSLSILHMDFFSVSSLQGNTIFSLRL